MRQDYVYLRLKTKILLHKVEHCEQLASKW